MEMLTTAKSQTMLLLKKQHLLQHTDHALYFFFVHVQFVF